MCTLKYGQLILQFWSKSKKKKRKPETSILGVRAQHQLSTDEIWPLSVVRSAPLKCFPRQTSCPDSGVRSSHGSSDACQLGACGRTCTAPPVCTVHTTKTQLLNVTTNFTHLSMWYDESKSRLTWNNKIIKLIGSLAQTTVRLSLITWISGGHAICETCPECSAVSLPHLTCTVLLCRLQLITLTTVSFSSVLYQDSMVTVYTSALSCILSSV